MCGGGGEGEFQLVECNPCLVIKTLISENSKNLKVIFVYKYVSIYIYAVLE